MEPLTWLAIKECIRYRIDAIIPYYQFSLFNMRIERFRSLARSDEYTQYYLYVMGVDVWEYVCSDTNTVFLMTDEIMVGIYPHGEIKVTDYAGGDLLLRLAVKQTI